MSKRTSFAGLLGNEDKAEDESGTPPVSALLHTITSNPDNPRDVDELELDEMVQSFHEVGQLQPVLAVSRDVYLRHKPQHATTIGDALYVVLGGNRRLEAAQRLGWARIDIALRDDLGDGEGSLDEAVIIENIHRKALAPIKEAGFLQGMVDRYGSQGKVAQRIGKTQAYVSQRLALLKLEPELQRAVDAGTLKVKEARTLAAVPQGQQRQAWRESKTAAPPAAEKRTPPAPPPSTATPRTHNPVMSPAPVASSPRVPEQSTSAPEPRSLLPDVVTVEAVPWGDPEAFVDLAERWMRDDVFTAVAELMLKRMRKD